MLSQFAWQSRSATFLIALIQIASGLTLTFSETQLAASMILVSIFVNIVPSVRKAGAAAYTWWVANYNNRDPR